MICPRCGYHCGVLMGGGTCCSRCWREADEPRGGTLPIDEWEEMSLEDRKAARRQGIRPEYPEVNEDVEEEIRKLTGGNW